MHAAAWGSPNTISSLFMRFIGGWGECPNETVSHESSRCAQGRRPDGKRRLDQHAGAVPDRPEDRRVGQAADWLDGFAAGCAPRQAPPSELRRIFLGDARERAHLY